MNTPKLLISAALVLTSFSLSAQHFNSSVEAGITLSNPSESSKNTQAGINLGVRGEYTFKNRYKGLFISSGLSITSKPWNMVNDVVSVEGLQSNYFSNDDSEEYYGPEIELESVKFKINPYFLQIPLQLGYRFKINDNFQLHVEGGMYAAYSFAGSAKLKLKCNSYYYDQFEVTKKLSLYDDVGYNQFDYGLVAGVGATLHDHWQVSLKMNYQLNHCWENWTDWVYEVRNRTATISLGYRF